MGFEKIEIEMTASARYVVTDEAIESFAHTSGDFNPIHLDQAYAEKAYFVKRVAHGMQSASLFSGIFGTELPGPGCLYVGQNLRFRRPVFVGDHVTATVTVIGIGIGIDTEKRIVEFDTKCWVKDEIVIFGTAELFVPKIGTLRIF